MQERLAKLPTLDFLRTRSLIVMPTDFIIDPEAIENLRALTPEDPESFLREIIGIFLDDTPARIDELRQGLANGDQAQFTRAAHSIKGSSSNLGAGELREISSDLEQRAKQHGVAGLEPRVTDLENAFAAAKVALEKLITPA